jgi:putative ABC transport system permease protein
MAALSALVGAISIASTAYSGVTERTGEFGLRRAFGAKPKHIRRQVITETLAIAVLAAITGELFGLVVSLVISRINNWVTIIDPRILAVIPAGAALLGIAAATIPARKASRIDPSVALRAV